MNFSLYVNIAGYCSDSHIYQLYSMSIYIDSIRCTHIVAYSTCCVMVGSNDSPVVVSSISSTLMSISISVSPSYSGYLINITAFTSSFLFTIYESLSNSKVISNYIKNTHTYHSTELFSRQYK